MVGIPRTLKLLVYMIYFIYMSGPSPRVHVQRLYEYFDSYEKEDFYSFNVNLGVLLLEILIGIAQAVVVTYIVKQFSMNVLMLLRSTWMNVAPCFHTFPTTVHTSKCR